MKIAIDVNHPAHVHFFRHFISAMEKNGGEVLITAHEKDVTCPLLDHYGLNYVKLGMAQRGLFRKAVNVPFKDFMMYRAVKDFDPDIFMGIDSYRAAHVSRMMNRSCIVFDDTETGFITQSLYRPFADSILTPASFRKDLGRKQVFYDGYHELAYLHPNYFVPDPSVFELLRIKKHSNYVVIRFVSWDAAHDMGQKGLSIKNKIRAVQEYSKYAAVFVSCEGRIPDGLEKYHIKIPPEKMHDVLYYATLFYGEGATMASECAILGTPAIFINDNTFGVMEEKEKKYRLIFKFKESSREQEESIGQGVELLRSPGIKKLCEERCKKLIADKIDVTSFMVWYVSNYPGSFRVMRETPEYQNKFRKTSDLPKARH